MSTGLHRRYAPHSAPRVAVERRTDAPAGAVIRGVAAVFYRAGDPGTEYQLGPNTWERIGRTAFDRAVTRDDVRALFNHDDNLVLGRTTAGTLKLSVTALGLEYIITPPNTEWARGLVESIRRGDVTGSSFAFTCPHEKSRRFEENGRDIVERQEVTLYDVGPVTYPAYPATSAGAGGGSVRSDVEALFAREDAKDVLHAIRLLDLFETD